VDGYPTTATGKIRRVDLRAMAATVLLEPLPPAEAVKAPEPA
jgi:acyl-coenzyme A synthetase/AMP-(fatty) acid ligase